MATNARAQRAIDYGLAMSSPSLAQRIELALMCQISGVVHETPCDVLQDHCGGYADQLANSTDPMDQWLHRLCAGGPLPDLALPVEDGYPLTHAIFAHTDFGRSRKFNIEAIGRVDEAMKAETNMDLIGEYLICRYALIAVGMSGKEDTFKAYFDQPVWGDDYHPYFVGGILYGLTL